MNCNRCLFSSNICELTDTQCEYCDIHDMLEKTKLDFNPILKKIQSIKNKYNCIMGISGGKDSTTLLYMAVKIWNLRPLVIHFDNHWNTPIAEENMKNLIQKLNVDLIRFNVNKEEFDNLNKAFLMAGVPDADIPNDIAMTKLMYQTAEQFNIKYILNGHCFRTEGSTPKQWTYMDSKYISGIYRKFFKKDLKNFPLFTFSDQLHYSNLKIEQVRPFHYKNVDRSKYDEIVKKELGWRSYGWKHGENKYTDFVGSYLLPRKFGIDKRIVYLSAQVRSGVIDKDDAWDVLNIEPDYDTNLIGEEYLSLINGPVKSRDLYEKYDFKRAKWLIYYLYVTRAVPYTFYIKYSEKVKYDYHNLNEFTEKDLEEFKEILKNEKYHDKELEEIRKDIIINFL